MAERPSIVEELKRRKVFRVAAIYGATVFAVLQVADILIDPLALPGWTLRFLVFLAVVGLPVALALAWAFEVRPDGVARTADADVGGTDATPRPPTTAFSRRTVFAVGALLAVGFGAGWLFAPGGRGGAGTGDAAPGAGRSAIRANGIAVLPFQSRDASGGSADFFAAGLHDDLLTMLAAVPELVVISRTSVEQYRDTDKNVRTIGEELGVAYVLEGGVQHAADRLRVNAQLIDARTDEHLWAETLDGDLSVTDIFAIQTELAQRIVGAMATTLRAGSMPGGDAPTESLAAWEAFTRGREAEAANEGALAEAAFEEAVAADPGFAEAWARLSQVRSFLHWFGADRATEARDALDQALVLAPDAPSTDWAKATFEYYVQLAYLDGLASARKAVAAAPGTAANHYVLGNLLRRVGDFEGAADAFVRAVELDPRNASYLGTLLETLAVMDDTAAADRWYAELLELPEPNPYALQSSVYASVTSARVGRTRALLDRMPASAREEPAVALVGLWTDALDPATPTPSTEALRAALDAAGWGESRGTPLFLEFVFMLLPPDADRAHLEWVARTLDERLAVGGGAQQDAVDRALHAHALALLGREDEARAQADRVLAWVRRTGDGNVGGTLLYDLAVTADVLGDRDRAVELLRESATRWTFPHRLIAVDPTAAGLASDPRVRALVRDWSPPSGT